MNQSEVTQKEDELMNDYQYDRAGYLQAAKDAGLNVEHAAESYAEVMRMIDYGSEDVWAARPTGWRGMYIGLALLIAAAVIIPVALWLVVILPRAYELFGRVP